MAGTENTLTAGSPHVFTYASEQHHLHIKKIQAQLYDSFVCLVQSIDKLHFMEAFHSYIFPSIRSVVAHTAYSTVR